MGTCLGTACHGSVRPAAGCSQTGVLPPVSACWSQPRLLLSVALVVSGITCMVKVCTMGQDRLMDGLDPGG